EIYYKIMITDGTITAAHTQRATLSGCPDPATSAGRQAIERGGFAGRSEAMADGALRIELTSRATAGCRVAAPIAPHPPALPHAPHRPDAAPGPPAISLTPASPGATLDLVDTGRTGLAPGRYTARPGRAAGHDTCELRSWCFTFDSLSGAASYPAQPIGCPDA